MTLFRQVNPPPGIVAANTALGAAAKEQGRYAQANTYQEENLAICRTIGSQRGVALALLELSNNFYWTGDYARTIELAQQSLDIYRELKHKLNLASSLETVGMAMFKLGDPAHARPLLEESLALYREMESPSGEVLVLSSIGQIDQALGDVTQAVKDFQDALRIAHELGDKRRMAFSLEGLAEAWAESDPARGARILGAAHALREAIRSPLPPGEQAGYTAMLNRTQSALGETVFRAAWQEGSQFTFIQILETASVKLVEFS